MVQALDDVVIRPFPHTVDCISWSDDHISLVTPSSVRLIQASPRTNVHKPTEIEPCHADLGLVKFSCQSEDANSLAEAGDIRIISSCYSPAGLSCYCLPFIALLTADHRVAIYGPTKDPNQDSWQLQHSLLSDALSRTGHQQETCIEALPDIQHLRMTSIAWTPALYQGHSRWGKSFLLTGNEAGELHFHYITTSSQVLVHIMKCSDRAITKIKVGEWTPQGILFVVMMDISGAVILARCKTVLTDNEAKIREDSDYATIFDNHGIRCTNLAILTVSEFQILIAVTLPGKVRVAIHDSLASKTTFAEEFLPFYSAVSSLCWAQVDKNNPSLVILGHTGKFLVLYYNSSSSTLSNDDYTSELIAQFAQDKLEMRPATAESDSDIVEMRYFGATVSPGSLILAISYALDPVNKIKYFISATSKSAFSTIQLTNDPQEGLTRVLSRFLYNPYEVSISSVLGLHKQLEIPVLQSLDAYNARGDFQAAENQDGLASRLFRSHFLNGHRLAVLSGDLAGPTLSSVLTDLRKILILEVLERACDETRVLGRLGREMALRYADLVSLHLRNEPELLDAAVNFYKFVELQGEPLGEAVHSFVLDPTGTFGPWPARDICPACEAPVPIGDTEFVATCSSGHIWPRCSITLELLVELRSRSCLECGRKAVIRETVENDTLYAEVLDACDICYYCTGKWSCKV